MSLKRILSSFSAFIILVIAIMLIRTFNYGSNPNAGIAKVELPEPPVFNLERATQNLSQAIQIKTVTYEGGDPKPGEEGPWLDLRAFLKLTYPQVFATVELEYIEDYTLLLTWKGEDRSLDPIMLMAHQDVVPINKGTLDDWTYPAFDGRIADGRVWGRGALDDKGSMIAIFEAADALMKSGYSPKRDIIFLFGHDEEVSGRGAESAFAHLKTKGVSPKMVLDEGFAILEDMPLTGKPAGFIGIAEKGYVTFELTAHAIGGHSSTPPRESGAVRLARAIIALEENQMPGSVGMTPVKEMMESFASDMPFMTRFALANRWILGGVVNSQMGQDQAANAMMRTTTAPTMLEGSIKENVLPQAAKATINFRVHPQDSVPDIEAHIKKQTAHIEGISFEIKDGAIGSEASPLAPVDNDVYATLFAVAQNTAADAHEEGDGHHHTPIAPGLVLGATDSRYAVAVTNNIYRFQPAVWAQKELAGFHGTDERLSIDNLERMIKGYAQIMMVLAEED